VDGAATLAVESGSIDAYLNLVHDIHVSLASEFGAGGLVKRKVLFGAENIAP